MLSVRNNENKLKISGREVTLNQQYAAVGICSLPLYYWAGVGQAVFWVIGKHISYLFILDPRYQ